jgi:hypothetical protein
MSDIKKTVKELSEFYHTEKKAKKQKDALRLKFFEEVTKALSEEDLAEDLVVVEASDETEAKERIKANYPAYKIEAVRKHPDLEGQWEGIIIENPKYKSFSVEVDGEIWQRQTTVGSPTVDSDRLAEEDPDLFEEVTFIPEPERQMKPLKDLDPVALARLQKYVVSGSVTLKLPAPKEVK